MKLLYLPVNFQIKFATPVKADNNPVFVLRSILGKQLRQMACISRQSVCLTCMYNKTCAYAYIFESIVEKKNSTLPGRNTISHPYCVSQNSNFVYQDVILESFDFTITLFGRAIDYLPYFYAAFVRGGREGLFKERIPFEIEDVKINGDSLLLNKESIRTDFEVFVFDLFQPEENLGQELSIKLKTPLRFKSNGTYNKTFSAQAFWNCLYRRAKTMFLSYGQDCKEDDFPDLPQTATVITDSTLHWMNVKHYSARQKYAMELGGVVGNMSFTGNLSNLEVRLLEFAKIANAGKNTNFGLGQLDYSIR